MIAVSYIRTDKIKPAEYNPRKISDEDFGNLCESLRVLGIIVPVIVNPRNSVIIAGHQRQKAAKAIGLAEMPCFYADNVSASDEVLFNQIHNGTDYDLGCIDKVSPQTEPGWTVIDPSDNFAACDKAVIVTEVCKLIQRYGNVLSCVVTMDGEVFKSAAYLMACKLLNLPANAYVVDEAQEEFARKAFSANYGVFSYEHLEKRTWVQGTAQLYRHKDKGKKGRTCKSRLYERLVLKDIDRGMAILDFGAGKEGYATDLKRDGYDIDCIEFYHNNNKGIDVGRTEREVERCLGHLRSRGLYDAVVCDSVLNSVDSMEAERSVVATCNAMLKMGGILYLSGRRREECEGKMRAKHAASSMKRNGFEFLDADGFSARFRHGNFYYQKYHTQEQIDRIIKEHGFELKDTAYDANVWRVKLQKVDDSPYIDEGVRFEFSLPYPGGRYRFADEAMAAVSAAREISANGRTASCGKFGTPASPH